MPQIRNVHCLEISVLSFERDWQTYRLTYISIHCSRAAILLLIMMMMMMMNYLFRYLSHFRSHSCQRWSDLPCSAAVRKFRWVYRTTGFHIFRPTSCLTFQRSIDHRPVVSVQCCLQLCFCWPHFFLQISYSGILWSRPPPFSVAFWAVVNKSNAG